MAFCVELFIHVDRVRKTFHLERTGENQSTTTFGTEVSNTGRKRKGVLSTSKGTKRPKATILQSSFVPSNNLPAVEEAVVISFKRTICTIDPITAKPCLTETDHVESGLLDKIVINLPSAAHGRTKEIYGLKIGNKNYVAKKLINIGNGHEDIDAVTAAPHLTKDLIRLRRMAMLVELFFERAKNEGAEVADFQVSDGFLIKIYKPLPFGEAADDLDLNDNEPMDTPASLDAIYLVEPRRVSAAVTKFSGTLGVRNRSDKQSATIMAFNHFVLEHTACKYMFADIQGTSETTATGKRVVTLFDPMTHSPTGTSGLGDFGLSGIKDFIDHHSCSTVCRRMQLCDSATLEATYKSLAPAEDHSDSDNDVDGDN